MKFQASNKFPIFVIVLSYCFLNTQDSIYSHPRSLKKQVPQYGVKRLPPVPTPLGNLPSVGGIDLNNRGEVVGSAVGKLPGSDANIVGFLYSPENGMKLLDPSGLYRSMAWRINDRGQVYGQDRVSGRYSMFLYNEGKGFESAIRGLSRTQIGNFLVTDMNNSGILIGFAQDQEGPYRYTSGKGWESLRNVHPTIKSRWSSPILINDKGDIVFTIALPGGISLSYLWLENRELIDLGNKGRLNSPSDLNEAGQVVGGTATKDYRERGYVFTPGKTLKQIHPKGWYGSVPKFIASDGTICVMRSDVKGLRDLYFYRPGEGYKIAITAEQFQSLMPTGLIFRSAEVQGMNDRLELFGDLSPIGNFYYSPKTGLLSVSEIAEQAGINSSDVAISDINEKGQLLVYGPGRQTAVLTPVDPQ